MKTQVSNAKTSLMKVLWDIQKKRRFISHDDMTKISKNFNISRMELEGVISFYHFYHRTHAGKYTIYLNNSIISKHEDFEEVKKAFEDELDIKTGHVTEDLMFGLFETSCIGLSDQETSALINFNAFTNLTPKKVKKIIEHLKKGKAIDDISNYPKDNIRYTPKEDKTIFFKPFERGSAIKKLSNKFPQDVVEIVKEARLSGRGGAFFPTGMKWQFCRATIRICGY